MPATPSKKKQKTVHAPAASDCDNAIPVYTVKDAELDAFIKKRDALKTYNEGAPNLAKMKSPSTGQKYKVIAPFNFKGGVGKTTLSVNLGARLAAKGKRVLLVDCDPQTNLTGFLTPIAKDGADDNDDGAEGSITPQTQYMKNSDVIQTKSMTGVPINNLEGGIFAGCGIKDIKAALAPAFKNATNVNPPKSYLQCEPALLGDRLLLIPGSTTLFDYDKKLNLAGGQDFEPALKSAFRQLFDSAAQVVRADYVIVDCGPSSSLLNKCILLGVDYILPPSFADYFSLSSMHAFLHSFHPSLQAEIDQIQASTRRVLSSPDEGEATRIAWGFYVPRLPKILPFIVTNYKTQGRQTRGDNDGQDDNALSLPPRQLQHAYGKFVQTMTEVVSDHSVPRGTRKRMFPDKGINGAMVIPLLKQLPPLISTAGETGVPAVLMDKQWFKTYGGMYGIPSNSQGTIKEMSKYMAGRIDGLISMLEELPTIHLPGPSKFLEENYKP